MRIFQGIKKAKTESASMATTLMVGDDDDDDDDNEDDDMVLNGMDITRDAIR